DSAKPLTIAALARPAGRTEVVAASIAVLPAAPIAHLAATPTARSLMGGASACPGQAAGASTTWTALLATPISKAAAVTPASTVSVDGDGACVVTGNGEFSPSVRIAPSC